MIRFHLAFIFYLPILSFFRIPQGNQKSNHPQRVLRVIARVEVEVIEWGRYPDMKTVSSMATSEPSNSVT